MDEDPIVGGAMTEAMELCAGMALSLEGIRRRIASVPGAHGAEDEVLQSAIDLTGIAGQEIQRVVQGAPSSDLAFGFVTRGRAEQHR
jgi:hypothetical protein